MGRTTEADAVLEIIKKVDEVCKSRGKKYDDRMIKHYITMGRIIKYWHWPAQLFIFFEESKIYAYTRLPVLLNTRFSSQNVDEENIENKNKGIEILIEEYLESKKHGPINKTKILKIKKDLLLYINKNKEEKVKNCGQLLNGLISEKTKLKEELQNENDKIKNVVICCKDEDIDYVWEWIYWKEKKFFGADKFFWGDKFHIVRIPRDGIPDWEFKNSNFQINTVTILKDDCPVAWNICDKICDKLNDIVICEKENLLDNTKLKSLYLFSWDSVPGSDNEKLIKFLEDDFDIDWAKDSEISKPEDRIISISKDENSAVIMIDEEEEKATLKMSDDRTCDLKVKNEDGKLNIYRSLSIPNCIHIGASRETFEGENLTTIRQRLPQRKPFFLFLNIFSNEPSSTFDYVSKLINPRPATIWIDSTLNIPENFAKLFVNNFYDELIKELSNGGANIVEIVAKIRKNEKIKDNLLRFAYVVNGNPCARFTRA